jgi:hypothetical protein
MLHWIPKLGGLPIMMGQHDRSESLFYYFRIEDQVPENHLLRLIDRHVSFDFACEKLRDSYSETGRCSVICTESPARGGCWKSAYTWHGAGSPGWVSIRRFRTIRLFPRTDTDTSRTRICFRSCSSASSSRAGRANRCQSMAASSKPAPITTVVSYNLDSRLRSGET